MTPDHLKSSGITGIYMALEDFVEYSVFKEKKDKKETSKPFLSCKGLLRNFVSIPSNNYIVLGVKRSAFCVKKPNNSEALRIMTPGGNQLIDIKDIVNFYEKLSADIIISPIDISNNVGNKQLNKMIERSKSWLKQLLENKNNSFIFASLPLASKELLSSYFLVLESNLSKIHGLALYNSEQSEIIPNSLAHLPLFLVEPIQSPHLILNCIENSIDLFTIDFISQCSNAGIALTFQFPPSISTEKNKEPLGIDMQNEEHKTALLPLLQECEFTKELLGYVLLQL
ncbi:hypothetical protein PMAC_002669 [Pneumocystis sp. 'macacae']|nr:hypothetical protein PMAC_002669 [Pneumocystis sp. 'macacae']